MRMFEKERTTENTAIVKTVIDLYEYKKKSIESGNPLSKTEIYHILVDYLLLLDRVEDILQKRSTILREGYWDTGDILRWDSSGFLKIGDYDDEDDYSLPLDALFLPDVYESLWTREKEEEERKKREHEIFLQNHLDQKERQTLEKLLKKFHLTVKEEEEKDA